jgi:hypothetical protein
MMDCGKQAAKLSLSRWFSRSTIAEWRRRLTLQIQALTNSNWLWRSSGTIQSALGRATAGLLESTVSGGTTLYIASSSAIETRQRKNGVAVRCLKD